MPRVFTTASDETFCNLIAGARERLVIVSPGLSIEVAEAFAERIALDGGPPVLSVIVDIDPEVCRLGYGEIAAVDILRSALASKSMQLQTQLGIRIGIVVADEEIFVFSPTPKLIEAGSESESSPNAVRITPAAALDIARACGAGSEDLVQENQEVGLEFVDERKLADVKQNLKEIPPRQFDLARLERVFNYSLEYVEFSVEDFKLNSRSVPLPPELLGLAEKSLQDRIKNSFRIFESGSPFVFEIPDPPVTAPSHEASGVTSKTVPPTSQNLSVSEKWIATESGEIRKEFFIPMGSSSHGNLILKRLKPEFEKRVERLSKIVDKYAEMVMEDIAEKIKDTRDDLVEALYPGVRARPQTGWLRKSLDGILTDEALKARLDMEVAKAFDKVKTEFKPKLACIFKGVNYDTITKDADFREKIEAHFGKQEAGKLLSEYDASRAQ